MVEQFLEWAFGQCPLKLEICIYVDIPSLGTYTDIRVTYTSKDVCIVIQIYEANIFEQTLKNSKIIFNWKKNYNGANYEVGVYILNLK